MRRTLTWALLLPLAVAGLLSLAVAPGFADGGTECGYVDPESGMCVIVVQPEPGPETSAEDDGPEQTDGGSPCYWDPAPQGPSGPAAGPVPCTSDHGYWSNSYDCYIERLDPQPPPTAPFWEGAYVEGGAVYQCFQPQTGTAVSIWLAEPPPPSGAGPSPGEVARLAVDQMNLSAINIGIAPEPGEGSIGLVGMPVWMWADHPDEHTFGPNSASASAGGITVTATAEVDKVTWVMGDGAEVVCHTAGTPYKPSFGMKPSPDCGHVYQRSSAGAPGDRYTVTALTDWIVRWQGAGQSGVIRMDGLERSVQIAVGEAQVLVS